MTVQAEAKVAATVGRLEYSPSPITGVVEHRAGGRTTMYVRAPWTAYLFGMKAPMVLALFTSVLFYVFGYLPRHDPNWSVLWLTIPLLFALITALLFLERISPLLFPTVVEVTESELILRWRLLTGAHHWKIARSEVRDVLAERVALHEGWAKGWHLCVLNNQLGRIAVLKGKRRQLERLAEAVRRALGIRHESIGESFTIPKGCRFKRDAFGDGMRLVLPARFRLTVQALAATGCLMLATAGYIYLRKRNFGENGDPTLLVRLNAAGLGIMLASFLYLFVYQALEKCRRKTVIVRNSARTVLVQSGMIEPFSAEWKTADGGKFGVAKNGAGRKVLRVVDPEGKVLELGAGEEEADLAWVASLLNAIQTTRAGLRCPRGVAGMEQHVWRMWLRVSLQSHGLAGGNRALAADIWRGTRVWLWKDGRVPGWAR